MAVVTPTVRPKYVRNRCVIEILVAFLCCHVAFFFIFFRCGGLCHRAGSDLFLFLLFNDSTGITQCDSDIGPNRMCPANLEAKTDSVLKENRLFIRRDENHDFVFWEGLDKARHIHVTHNSLFVRESVQYFRNIFIRL